MKHSICGRAFGALLAGLFLLWLSAPLAAAPKQKSDEVRVIYVIDGDTLQVQFHGRKERLRLIGVDSPEVFETEKATRDSKRTHQDIKTIEALGKESSRFTKGLVGSGDALRIEFDRDRRDRYDRLLVYVYLKDGSMLNEQLLRRGYGKLMTIPPNVKYVSQLRAAERYAKETRAGLWGSAARGAHH